MTEGLSSIIEQLERQKAAIDRALEALQFVRGATAAAAVNKRSEAQKARWAKTRSTGPGTRRGGGLTAKGRARLAENMRKRWAAKRTAAQAKRAAKKRKS